MPVREVAPLLPCARGEAVERFRCAWTTAGGEVAWGRLTGDVDIDSLRRLERALREPEAQAPLVVLDLRGVRSLDGAAVHVIGRAAAWARHSRRRLIALRGPPRVERAFRASAAGDEVERFALDAGVPAVLVLLQLARPEGAG